MPTMAAEPCPAARNRETSAVILRLLVRNHPGVMSHVCGLFARRAFNVEGILCRSIGDATRSTILLLVNEDERLEQMIRQLRKLEDVIEIDRAPQAYEAFVAAARHLCQPHPASRVPGKTAARRARPGSRSRA